MSDWGDRIRDRRLELGMTARELARQCEISSPSVSDWENDQTRMIDGANLLKAAKALQTTPEWIMTGKGARDLSQSQQLSTYRLGVAIVSAREAARSLGLIIDEVKAADLISLAYREAAKFKHEPLTKQELKDFDAMVRHMLRSEINDEGTQRSTARKGPRITETPAARKKAAGRGR